MREHRQQKLSAMTLEKREHIAENMKERVYATITLLAVIAGLWQTASQHSVKAAALTIFGTAVALWLATIIAGRISYRAVHQKSMRPKDYRKLLFTSSGLFGPAIMPILVVLFSATHLITLKTALMIAMIMLALSMFVLSFMAGWRIYDSRIRLLFVSSLEMLVGVSVIVLKLALGE